jgi:hypothetical protein
MKTLHETYAYWTKENGAVGHTREVETMSVAELREALADLPGDAPVFATWEGQMIPILGEKLTVCDWSFHSHPEERQPTLIFDVDY